MAGFLRRLVLLAVALGAATVLLVGAMATLTPTANAGTMLERDQGAAVERGVTQHGDEPESNGASSMPVVALVFAGIMLLAALPPAQRVHVYYHRPPGSYWQ